MAILLTSDPLVTEQECKDILGMNDGAKTIVLINSVSAKFLKYTNRVLINEGAVVEVTRAVDNRLIWAHATPMGSEAVTVEVLDNLGAVQETYTTADGTLVVDRKKGKIARPNCETFPIFCGMAAPSGVYPSGECSSGAPSDGVPFPNLRLSYTGGWGSLPGDLVMSAFEQIKLELERLKGNTALTAGSTFGEQVAFEKEDLSKSVLSVWKRYRILL